MRQVGRTERGKVKINSIIEELKACHEAGDSFCLVIMRQRAGGMYECDVTYDHPQTRAAAIEVLRHEDPTEDSYIM